MKLEYPDSKSDLFAAFIERCADLTARGGASALITMQSWMFLSSYEKLRHSLLRHQQITSMLHLGARAFDSIGGEVVSSTAFVLSRQAAESLSDTSPRNGVFIRLVDGTSEAEKIAATRNALTRRDRDSGYYLASGEDFISIPGSPIVYWLSEKMRASFTIGRPLSDMAELREGMSTGDNDTFMRAWWEVSAGRSAFGCGDLGRAEATGARWFPFNKGGAFRKWYGNQEYVVNWENGGETIRSYGIADFGRARSRAQNTRYFFEPSISWSKISSGDPSFRSYPEAFTFGSAAKAIYLDPQVHTAYLLCVCNSSLAQSLLAAKSPTLSFLADDIGSLPMILGTPDQSFIATEEKLTAVSKSDWDSSETAWDFERNPLLLRT